MNEILTRYVEKIKEINTCGADVVMDSVWVRLLGDFYQDADDFLKTATKFTD